MLPKQPVLTIDPVERLCGLGKNVARRDALYWTCMRTSKRRKYFFHHNVMIKNLTQIINIDVKIQSVFGGFSILANTPE